MSMQKEVKQMDGKNLSKDSSTSFSSSIKIYVLAKILLGYRKPTSRIHQLKHDGKKIKNYQ